MQIANRLAGVGEYYFSQKLKEIQQLNLQGKQIINLGIGNPDLPPHPDVLQTLSTALQRPDVHGYQSYIGVEELRNAIAKWYQQYYQTTLDPNGEILPLIGSKEGIMHLCMTYLNNGDQVLIPDPGYPTYSSAVQLAGGRCVGYQLNETTNWYPDFSALEKLDLQQVKMMWFNYPHMPTGALPTTELFDNIIAFGKKHNILLCHDNPYSFIGNETPMSILSRPGAMDVAVELNSLSKSHNMAGWRMGMLCGNRNIVASVLRFRSNMDSGMFLPLQLAAANALALGSEWYQSLNKIYNLRKQKVFALLSQLNCTWSPHQAGLFVWARIPGNVRDGFALSDDVLYKASVFITPGGIFGEAGNNYVRVSLCNKETSFDQALERIKLHL